MRYANTEDEIKPRMSMAKTVMLVPAVHFVGTVMANVDNDKLSDADFRQFIRNTLSVVEKPQHRSIANKEVAASVAKYYPADEIGIDERMELMKFDLDAYFKDTYIEEYEILKIDGNRVTMLPVNPYFYEDYSDDVMDKMIKKIGEKYNLIVRWSSEIYGK